MIQPGELNRRLTLEAPLESDDGAGGVTRAYQAAARLWARIVPLAARPAAAADSLGQVRRMTVIIRMRDDVSTRHRLREGARVYRVLATRPSEDGRFLVIDAEEWDD